MHKIGHISVFWELLQVGTTTSGTKSSFFRIDIKPNIYNLGLKKIKRDFHKDWQ